MKSEAKTVKQYLASLPAERRTAIKAIRKVILANLDDGYEEGMQYGMIGYYVPHSIYPPGYHCDPAQPLCFAGLASQKNHMALYLMCIYSDAKLAVWFKAQWVKSGKRLDMGKSCIRFKKLEDVPLDVIGKTIARVPVAQHIKFYESAMEANTKKSPTARRRAKSR